jgi:hypothetical protein
MSGQSIYLWNNGIAGTHNVCTTYHLDHMENENNLSENVLTFLLLFATCRYHAQGMIFPDNGFVLEANQMDNIKIMMTI